jgi:hypothetical protein
VDKFDFPLFNLFRKFVKYSKSLFFAYKQKKPRPVAPGLGVTNLKQLVDAL